MKKRVVLFGTGKGSEIATRYLKNDSSFEVVAYAVQEEYLKKPEHLGLPVTAFENLTTSFAPSEFALFAPLGFQDMNQLRAKIYLQGKKMGYSFISYIHSSVAFVDKPQVGENCFILENQSINLDVKIGNNVTIWSHNHIGDRSVIEDHVWITSQCAIGGDVVIGAYSFLGLNATISNNVILGKSNFIGGNALITKSTEDSSVFVAPATPKAPMTSERFSKIAKIE